MSNTSNIEEVGSFVQMTNHLDNGEVRQELDKLITDAVQAIKDFGGKAEITFKVVFEKAGGFEDVIVITDSVKHKFPEPPRGKSLMFSTFDNKLVLQKQDQMALDLEFTESQKRSKPELAESTKNIRTIK